MTFIQLTVAWNQTSVTNVFSCCLTTGTETTGKNTAVLNNNLWWPQGKFMLISTAHNRSYSSRSYYCCQCLEKKNPPELILWVLHHQPVKRQTGDLFVKRWLLLTSTSLPENIYFTTTGKWWLLKQEMRREILHREVTTSILRVSKVDVYQASISQVTDSSTHTVAQSY